MNRLILISIFGLLVWAGAETARELAEGAFPRSLQTVLILAAMMFAQPVFQSKLGRMGVVLSGVCIAVAVGLIFLGPSSAEDRRESNRRLAEANDPASLAAAKATVGFHAALSEGRYGEICAASESGAFHSVTELDCLEFLAYLREKLGKFESNSLPSWYVEKRSGAPRVAAEMTTRYERAETRESFDWRVTGADGRVTLSSYHVRF